MADHVNFEIDTWCRARRVYFILNNAFQFLLKKPSKFDNV